MLRVRNSGTLRETRKRQPRKERKNKLLQVRIGNLIAYGNNVKQHGPKQLAALTKSILAYGFTNPIIVDEQNVVLAGHGRLQAAKLAGLTELPVIQISHLSEKEKKAYRLADNRLADLDISYSNGMLQLEVTSILELDPDFDLSLTGYDARDLELNLDAGTASKSEKLESLPPLGTVAISRPGDVWEIGEHKLVCGDAKSDAAFKQLLARERVHMVMADPPYGVAIQGHVSGRGKYKHREFLEGGGDMTAPELQRFLLAFMLQCGRFARPGALHYVWMDWRHLSELLSAGSVAYDEQLNLCVWQKSNAGLGSLYRSQHELCAVFKKGKASHTNNVELGKNGRHRSNVWSYPGMNSPSAERDAALAMHPTVKPLAMIRDAILDVTRRGDIVLDPFGGSGTTLIAAAKAGRIARLIELDPLYCDVIVRRSQQTLGLPATLAATDETFDVVATRREADDD